jgi:prepilin-type N-terminal cleavage/methylation domain-containing protein
MKRGFSIVEILVVVAIISVLLAVVIVRVDMYRNESANASIKATLRQAQIEANLFQRGTDSFDGLCNATEPFRILEQRTAACRQAFLEVNHTNCRCFDSRDSWVIAVPLRPGGDGDAWCVDSTDHGGPIDTSRFGTLSATVLCSNR